jgi:HEAT repeats
MPRFLLVMGLLGLLLPIGEPAFAAGELSGDQGVDHRQWVRLNLADIVGQAGHQSPEVRTQALDLLRSSGPDSTLIAPLLVDLFENRDSNVARAALRSFERCFWWIEDDGSYVSKYAAAFARNWYWLRRRVPRNPALVMPLLERADEVEEVRACVKALARPIPFGDELVDAVLRRMATHADARVRRTALGGLLSRFPMPRETWRVMLGSLDDEDERVRAEALRGLAWAPWPVPASRAERALVVARDVKGVTGARVAARIDQGVAREIIRGILRSKRSSDRGLLLRSIASGLLRVGGLIDEIAALLTAKEARDRLKAVRVLHALGTGEPRVKGILRGIRNDPDREVRVCVAQARWSLGDRDPLIIQGLRDELEGGPGRVWPSPSATMALTRLGASGRDTLLQSYEKGGPRPRFMAALGLAHCPEPPEGVRRTLLEGLLEPDLGWDCRSDAARVLVAIGVGSALVDSPETRERLEVAARRKDRFARTALDILASLADAGPEPFRVILRHGDTNQVGDVLAALRSRGDLRAQLVPDLLVAYDAERGPSRYPQGWSSRPPPLESRLDVALATMDQAGIPGLVLALSSTRLAIRHRALRAIEAHGLNASDAAPVLLRLFSEGDPGIRRLVAAVLGAVGSPEAVPALTAALVDRCPVMRAQAARSLGLIGGPARQAIPILDRLAGDGHVIVRHAASVALGRLR